MKTKHHSILSAPMTRGGGATMRRKIHPRFSALGLYGLLVISLCTLSPSPAQAECKQWDVTGKWAFQQSNGGKYYFDLQQHGTSFAGSVAGTPAMIEKFAVSGTMKGNDFYLKVERDWGGGDGPGIYRGTVGPQGRIEGNMYFTKSPDPKLSWFSTTAMKCADAINPRKVIKSFPKSTATVTSTPLPVKIYDANDPNRHGFIDGLQLATPTPSPEASAEADESSSTDTEDQPKKHKKKGKHHHHHDDDENQGNN